MRGFLLLPCWFGMNVLAYILAPILPLFSVWVRGPLDNGNASGMGFRLPMWLTAFDTPENALTGDNADCTVRHVDSAS